MQDSGCRVATLRYKKEPSSQKEEASLQGSVLYAPLATWRLEASAKQMQKEGRMNQ